MKLVEKDGKFFRMRRGVLVEIPPDWVGKTLHPQTKKKRPSKHIGKLKKLVKYGSHSGKRSKLKEFHDE
jgi:hypothetical protein